MPLQKSQIAPVYNFPVTPPLPLHTIEEETPYLPIASNYLMRKRDLVIYMDEEAFTPIRHEPERFLLAAVLERAKEDLSPWAKVSDRQDAVQWFEGRDMDFETAFSFYQICNVLELSARQLEFLKFLVAEAKTFEGKSTWSCRGYKPRGPRGRRVS